MLSHFVKRVAFFLLNKVSRIVDWWIPKNSKAVLIASGSGNDLSGSSLAIYQYLQHDPTLKVRYYLFDNDGKEAISFRRIKDLWYYWRTRVVIISHGIGGIRPLGLSSKKVVINVWHGMPTKGMAIAQRVVGEQEIKNAKNGLRFDYVVAPSRIAAQRFNYCVRGYRTKYLLCGQPRSDKLFHSDKSLQNIDFPKDTQHVLYAPTYRHYTTTRWFPYDDFDLERFNAFLNRNKIIIYLRPHINEKTNVRDYLRSNIRLFSADECLDIYDALPSMDCLITDYSSLYTDYLLCDKPIIFIHTDYKEYEMYNSFLVDECSFWFPGDRPVDGDHFFEALRVALSTPDRFSKERTELNKLVNYYEDGKACEKIARFIRAGKFNATQREIVL